MWTLPDHKAWVCWYAVPATQVYAPVPYYSGYEWPAEYYDSRLFEWTAGAAPEASADDPVIEIITAPNNPDGAMRNKTIEGKDSRLSQALVTVICSAQWQQIRQLHT